MQDFMNGRYGADELSFSLGVLGIVLALLATIFSVRVLSLIALAVLIIALARSFSKNISARRKENDAFLLAIQQKAEEKDAREVGVVKEARQEADEAYRAMVDTINVVANLEEGTTYDAFIGAVNQHIETQKTTLKSRATRNKNKKDEKPEEEEPDDRPVVQ